MFMGLCFDFNCNTGLEVHGEALLEDSDFFNQSFYQYLVKLRDRCGLKPDEVLQVLDQAHLFVLDYAVDFGLFSHIPEPENHIRDSMS